MITIYQLSLNIYKNELTRAVGSHPRNDLYVDSYLDLGNKWHFDSAHLGLSGVHKNQRLKVLRIDPKSEFGLEVLKYMAKVSKGTVIAVAEFDTEKLPIFIHKGQEFAVTLLELENGLRKVKASGDP